MTDDANDNPETTPLSEGDAASARDNAAEAEVTDDVAAEDKASETDDIEETGAPGILERKLGRLSTSGALHAVLVAVALGTIILAGLVLRPDPLRQEPDAVAPLQDKVDHQLSYGELLKVAESALSIPDFTTAKEALQAALAPLGDRQVKERLNIYEQLALIADEEEDFVLASAYRSYAATLRERLASAVVVFGEAEDALREKRYDEALRLYRKFLLRRDELPEEQRDFIDRARRQIATLWQERLGAAGALATKTNFEPEEWFDGR
jgi:hypothetical protein